MQSLVNRLEALERQAPPENSVDTIVVTFVTPGPNGPVRTPPAAVRCGDWRLVRDAGEEVEAFRKKALELCPRVPGKVALLFEEIA